MHILISVHGCIHIILSAYPGMFTLRNITPFAFMCVFAEASQCPYIYAVICCIKHLCNSTHVRICNFYTGKHPHNIVSHKNIMQLVAYIHISLLRERALHRNFLCAFIRVRILISMQVQSSHFHWDFHMIMSANCNAGMRPHRNSQRDFHSCPHINFHARLLGTAILCA